MKAYFKAKCRKTGKYFCLEVEKQGDKNAIVNFVDLTKKDADMLNVQYRVKDLVTAGNLQKCNGCGSRKFASCACEKNKKRSCRESDPYDFQCVYCNELELDYSSSSSSKGNPYGKWAGISNIPASAFDKNGNPQGSEFDLAKDGSMKGYRVVILKYCHEDWKLPECTAALNKKGFNVIFHDRVEPSLTELKSELEGNNTQLWILSAANLKMNPQIRDYIIQYYSSGHGVWIMGDNDPFTKEANVLLKALFDTWMAGNLPGGKIVSISKGPGKPGIIANHPITTGIVNFYEGITIATVTCNRGLKPLVYGSEGNIVTAYYDEQGKRCLADGGFTRLFHSWNQAGTDRFIVNAATWLANIEHFGYHADLPDF